MEIINVSPSELTPYAHNAKIHPPEQVEQIANSISRFGFRQPIVVDANNVVVIGHGRLMAAKRLGLETVPCVRADDLAADEIDALRLADNKTNESPWDIEALEMELARLNDSDLGFNMGEFGFDDSVMEEVKVEDVKEDEPDLTPPENPITNHGDIWKCGRHRVMCGDSTSIIDIEKLMGGGAEQIALLLTHLTTWDMRARGGLRTARPTGS